MSERKEFRDLADPERAREVVASLDLSAGTERVALEDARGRVLAERVDAALDVPGFDRAAMDGYAVRAPDTYGTDSDPTVLPVVGSVHAGETPDLALDDGEAAEISTGAVMPEGADAVVIVERTEELGGAADAGGAGGDEPDGDSDGSGRRVRIETAVTPGENVMLAGADIAAGERALGPGTELTPREIGLLSALGVDDLVVRATPRVAIVSTGDELVRPGGALDHRAGQIHDVNSYAVATAVEEAGGEPVVYPHVGDDMGAMEETLVEAAEECDLVLTSGSTSASAVDVVYRVVDERGELLLHGVAIKPGKPMLVGRIGGDSGGDEGAAYVGLPGYPVSALTIFRTFVAPAIRSSAGLPEPRTARIDGEMAVTERTEEGRRRLLAVGLVEDEAGETLVYPVDKGSGATTTLTAADGVVDVPADRNRLSAGERVTVDLFSPAVRPPTLLGVGEDDPALSRALDRLERPRYLARGSRGGLRELREGLPDVAVVAGPFDAGEEGVADAADLGGWSREWGLVVPAGNPDGVTGLADLVDRDLSFVNRGTESGLRTNLSNALADLADDRGVDRRAITESVSGFDRAARAFESPARSVAAGDADAGLGLRATAATLGLGFVPVGSQTVRVLANPDRQEKASVRDLDGLLEDVSPVLDGLDGFEPR
ncbi:molybdopterin biosynthesis protein MoeA/LysR substrate binding-domain-containing protein [Halosimplex carlsbadense 2-9-1]|uniref:Molybdopterin biosynthesis protein MoeA/LysR substrate binding-domain-containing protein n=1 Tax=Halosimplex carlsbadense 2-9-1 TaxID=797114 RepID=M0CSH9_9EURY|nr:molybdopterin biosynthesis protein [Halosimplex carlsbadense]ELZ24834.1 molybdopterin biosynthesis protein MoeA/LysR substrate binding-domain-containing protein [Halosimplex carlsbadense 2-9-1]